MNTNEMLNKLIAEIENLIEEVNVQCQKSSRPQFTLLGKINGLEQVLNLVRSLQQEQDNALTAEDCSIVMDAFFNYLADISAGRALAQNTKEGVYMEVLRRYKELKARKK